MLHLFRNRGSILYTLYMNDKLTSFLSAFPLYFFCSTTEFISWKLPLQLKFSFPQTHRKRKKNHKFIMLSYLSSRSSSKLPSSSQLLHTLLYLYLFTLTVALATSTSLPPTPGTRVPSLKLFIYVYLSVEDPIRVYQLMAQ